MKNICNQDYIIWDENKKAPLEALDIVYHHTTLVELINDGFKLREGEKFVCVAELPLRWQLQINHAIEATK